MAYDLISVLHYCAENGLQGNCAPGAMLSVFTRPPKIASALNGTTTGKDEGHLSPVPATSNESIYGPDDSTLVRLSFVHNLLPQTVLTTPGS